ncbi:unnamed protein product [Polarella glacialis]|uniref:Calmodulin-lysine N-methyltransferase n=1 Tax=Polarella glacialis TaxID=89957 RepID=A0A813F6F7_POLGL|nr:unnamed protein product [Polarella glacialis]
MFSVGSKDNLPDVVVCSERLVPGSGWARLPRPFTTWLGVLFGSIRKKVASTGIAIMRRALRTGYSEVEEKVLLQDGLSSSLARPSTGGAALGEAPGTCGLLTCSCFKERAGMVLDINTAAMYNITEREFLFDIPADDEKGEEQLRLRLMGYKKVGGDIVWRGARLLAGDLIRRGRSGLRGRTTLELGAGSGLLSAVCAGLGADALSTDGDEAEVPQQVRTAELFTDGLSLGGSLSAALLEWGTPACQEAHDASLEVPPALDGASPSRTPPLRKRGFDFVIGSDIVYMPRFIPALAETIEFFLADSGEALIANTAVATNTSHPEARAMFIAALEKVGLVVQEERPPDGFAFQNAKDTYQDYCYLLRISRPRSPSRVSVF